MQALAVVAAAAAVYFLIISPIMKLASRGNTRMERNLSNLERIDKMYQEYMALKEEKNKYQAVLNRKDENITALIEQWAAASSVTRNIAYTRRNQTNIQNKYIRITTDIKLDSVAIEPLMKFIYQIENSNLLLKINYLRIQQAIKGRDTYDVNIKIDNFTSQ